MLFISAALAAIFCDGGRYYCESTGGCVTVEECKNQNPKTYPYALARECIRDPPDTDSGIHTNTEGAYVCPSDKVTVFNASVVKCVSDLKECTGLFISTYRHACVDSYWRCDSFLKQGVYDENGEKLCASGAECKARGAVFGYSFYYCKTVAKCIADQLYPYVIGGRNRCRTEPPAIDGGFDPVLMESGVFACPDGLYPDFSRRGVQCIREQDCKQLYYKGRMCLTRSQCSYESKYLYVNGSRR